MSLQRTEMLQAQKIYVKLLKKKMKQFFLFYFYKSTNHFQQIMLFWLCLMRNLTLLICKADWSVDLPALLGDVQLDVQLLLPQIITRKVYLSIYLYSLDLCIYLPTIPQIITRKAYLSMYIYCIYLCIYFYLYLIHHH